jgi:predicted helicase
MNLDIDTYLKAVAAALKADDATEHTHRPALHALLSSAGNDINPTNEPKQIKCGAPDFVVRRKTVPIGYVECKDIAVDLNRTQKSEQLKRYRASLSNLILTDYLEFRHFIDGEPVMTARIASIDAKGKLRRNAEGIEQLGQMVDLFLGHAGPTVANPKELAKRMAGLAQILRDLITKALDAEADAGTLHIQLAAFKDVLLHNLTEEQFADMYAQTICYGLFAARCNVEGTPEAARFNREHAAYDLPRTNPFLRSLFNQMAGPELDLRIAWAVEDLAELLRRADIGEILRDFGKATQQEDPVVHFYETFLAAYDPKMREARGVYYTPEPVVQYIVQSVDYILRKDFGLEGGLANHSKTDITVKTQDDKGKTQTETRKVHRVQILDPAVGTGTFLHAVIRQIRDNTAHSAGAWSGYVREHLLPRVHGFELLMAPYTVAHMKLGLLLQETGYDFASDDRLGVYLTNTLEEAEHATSGLPLFATTIAKEANDANHVKKDAPIMVVLGNPPYSGHSENKGQWISGLIDDYKKVDGKPLGERNPKYLNDDYVKFIRFGQHRIQQTGYGVLAFISNHGYLDNPTFRGMRQSLMQTFDKIYILDLHGNSKKKETAPDGSKDENVFDIQQGVAICIMVKNREGN